MDWYMADPLSGSCYDKLDLGCITADSWSEQWFKEMSAGNTTGLMGLLHYGLRQPLLSDPRMIGNYLYLALHLWTYKQSPPSSVNVFGTQANRGVKYLIADKAWQELKRNFFSLSDDIGSGNKHERSLLLLSKLLYDQELARHLVHFFQNDKVTLGKDDAVVMRFLRWFLRLPFGTYDHVSNLFNPSLWWEYPSQDDRDQAQVVCGYYQGLATEFVLVIARHGLFEVLDNAVLTSEVEKQLRALAFTPQHSFSAPPLTLTMACLDEGESGFNSLRIPPVGCEDLRCGPSKYPEAARLLIIHTHLAEARKDLSLRAQSVNEYNKARDAERAREHAQNELQLAQRRMEELSEN